MSENRTKSVNVTEMLQTCNNFVTFWPVSDISGHFYFQKYPAIFPVVDTFLELRVLVLSIFLFIIEKINIYI